MIRVAILWPRGHNSDVGLIEVSALFDEFTRIYAPFSMLLGVLAADAVPMMRTIIIGDAIE